MCIHYCHREIWYTPATNVKQQFTIESSVTFFSRRRYTNERTGQFPTHRYAPKADNDEESANITVAGQVKLRIPCMYYFEVTQRQKWHITTADIAKRSFICPWRTYKQKLQRNSGRYSASRRSWPFVELGRRIHGQVQDHRKTARQRHFRERNTRISSTGRQKARVDKVGAEEKAEYEVRILHSHIDLNRFSESKRPPIKNYFHTIIVNNQDVTTAFSEGWWIWYRKRRRRNVEKAGGRKVTRLKNAKNKTGMAGTITETKISTWISWKKRRKGEWMCLRTHRWTNGLLWHRSHQEVMNGAKNRDRKITVRLESVCRRCDRWRS